MNTKNNEVLDAETVALSQQQLMPVELCIECIDIAFDLYNSGCKKKHVCSTCGTESWIGEDEPIERCDLCNGRGASINRFNSVEKGTQMNCRRCGGKGVTNQNKKGQ